MELGNFAGNNHHEGGPSGVPKYGEQLQLQQPNVEFANCWARFSNNASATSAPFMGAYPYMFNQIHQQPGHLANCSIGVLALITWGSTACSEVSFAGSWDSWTTRVPLHRTSNGFSSRNVFPPGVHRCLFIVDGHVRCSPRLPIEHDDMGNAFNILYLKAESDVEPSSPPSSYNNPTIEEFAELNFNGPPPDLPPQLPSTLPDEPPSTLETRQYAENWEYAPGPQPMMLNHVYVDRVGGGGGSALGLRYTQRSDSRYVTGVTYRSVPQ